MLAVALALAAAHPVTPTPTPLTSGEAAAAVVRRYYAALDARDYRTAHLLFANGQSLARMRRGYAATRWTRVVTIPPYETEGGAGSVYCEVTVVVTAMTRDGVRQRFIGGYTLRRINDVDGSTAAQRRWHIIQATLKQTPADR